MLIIAITIKRIAKEKMTEIINEVKRRINLIFIIRKLKALKRIEKGKCLSLFPVGKKNRN